MNRSECGCLSEGWIGKEGMPEDRPREIDNRQDVTDGLAACPDDGNQPPEVPLPTDSNQDGRNDMEPAREEKRDDIGDQPDPKTASPALQQGHDKVHLGAEEDESVQKARMSGFFRIADSQIGEKRHQTHESEESEIEWGKTQNGQPCAEERWPVLFNRQELLHEGLRGAGCHCSGQAAKCR